MATLEPLRFISHREYNEYRPSRLREYEIETDQLCTLFAQLEPGEADAARTPVRLKHVQQKIGAFSVSICLLDADLDPLFETEGTMENGFLGDTAGTIRVINIKANEQHVVEAFLFEYDEGISIEQLEACRDFGVAVPA